MPAQQAVPPAPDEPLTVDGLIKLLADEVPKPEAAKFSREFMKEPALRKVWEQYRPTARPPAGTSARSRAPDKRAEDLFAALRRFPEFRRLMARFADAPSLRTAMGHLTQEPRIDRILREAEASMRPAGPAAVPSKRLAAMRSATSARGRVRAIDSTIHSGTPEFNEPNSPTAASGGGKGDSQTDPQQRGAQSNETTAMRPIEPVEKDKNVDKNWRETVYKRLTPSEGNAFDLICRPGKIPMNWCDCALALGMTPERRQELIPAISCDAPGGGETPGDQTPVCGNSGSCVTLGATDCGEDTTGEYVCVKAAPPGEGLCWGWRTCMGGPSVRCGGPTRSCVKDPPACSICSGLGPIWSEDNNGFFLCANGCKAWVNCPVGTHFDKSSLKCQAP